MTNDGRPTTNVSVWHSSLVIGRSSSDAWHVTRAALRDTWSDLLTTGMCSLLWVVLNLLLVTGPPATLALFYVANRLAHGELTDPGDFLRAWRRYFGVGWRWGLINGGMLFLLVGDVILTGRLSQSATARLAQGFFLAGLVTWLLVQLYALPFLFEQETPSVRLALRNGAVMLGTNAPFSVVLGALLVLILLAGTVFFFVAFAACRPGAIIPTRATPLVRCASINETSDTQAFGPANRLKWSSRTPSE